jgi:hypothetical protein
MAAKKEKPKSSSTNLLLWTAGRFRMVVFFEKEIFAVGEVNHDKFGRLTPGTLIPIIAEKELLSLKPDFLIVLPWHFRDTFLKFTGGYSKIVFPLPRLEVH